MTFLPALLEAEKVGLCFVPGRTGWMLTTRSPLPVLRLRAGRWADRVTAVHARSGRYFVQPSATYLLRSLRGLRPGASESFHACPRRSDRLRRLEPFLKGRAASNRTRPSPPATRLALRLEWTARMGGAERLWRHMADDFDLLWATVPLYSRPSHPLEHLVLYLLGGEGMDLALSGKREEQSSMNGEKL